MAGPKTTSAPWYEALLDSLVGQREQASRSYRYMARMIEREFPTSAGGVALALCCPDGDRTSSAVLLMQAVYLQSELERDVLIIDARARDMGGGLSARLGMDRQPGFTELLSEGPARLAEWTRPSGVAGVTVLPRGGIDGSALIVHRRHLTELIAQAKTRWPYILVQLGAVAADTRNLVIATFVDAVLLLGQEEKTRLQVLEAAQSQLHDNGVEDVRLVLTAKLS